MLNPFEVVKAYLALNEAVADIKKGPKAGLYTSEFWTMVFTAAMVIVEGARGLIPPLYVVYAILGLSVLWQLLRFALKLKHIDLPMVPGLQPMDLQAMIDKLKVTHPELIDAARDALEKKPV